MYRYKEYMYEKGIDDSVDGALDLPGFVPGCPGAPR
jgi:hypothetical protein